jgi:hypothetical protein
MVESKASRRLATVKPRVLHDDRQIGNNHAGIFSAFGHRLQIGEIVEAQVARALGPDHEAVGTNRRAVGEIDGHFYLHVLIAAQARRPIDFANAESDQRLGHVQIFPEWGLRFVDDMPRRV